MSLNHVEIDAILNELDLIDTHLQKIKQTDFHSLYLEFYKPGVKTNILICLAPRQTRLHKVEQAPETEIKLQRFAQFLRSRVKGGRIKSISQINDDRILKIEIIRAGDPLFLWIRLWSNAANIICTDGDMNILDAFYRRPGKKEVTGEKFLLPEKKLSKKVFEIRHLPGDESFNKKISKYYSETKQAEDVDVYRTRVLKKLAIDQAGIESTINNLERKIKEYDRFEQYKQFGDLLMCNLHLIKRGDSWIETTNFYENNERIIIELDPVLSPEKNAEKYYKSYRKAKSGLLKVQQDLDNHRLLLKQLIKDQKKFEIETDLGVLKKFLSSLPKQTIVTTEKQVPGLKYRSGCFNIIVGRSAKENDILLRKHMRGNDFWLHTRDYPGGYVFIKTIKGKSVPLDTLLDAGNLALFYSKGKSSGRGELYYTQVKYLRRAKNGPLGLVLPTQEKNLSIILDNERLKRIMEDTMPQNP